MDSDRNQKKKARQKYLDILKLEAAAAAGGELNAEQQAKLGRKAEVAAKLEALGCDLPRLSSAPLGGPAAAAAPADFVAAGSVGSGGGGGGDVLRVRPTQMAAYSTVIPNSDLASSMAGIAPFNPSNCRVLGPEEQAAAARGAGASGERRAFVVKVQVPLGPHTAATNQPMLLYSRSRTFQCYVLESSSADARRLGQLVRSWGANGQKGYFHAWVEGEEVVLGTNLLPMQPW